MINKYNLHTHSVYCDGKDTPEEMICEAIERGLYAIGFSGHSYAPFDPEVSMIPEGTRIYRNKVRELREKYKSHIKVYLGIERELFSPNDDFDYDYTIASSHYIKTDGEYIPIDLGRDVFEKLAEKLGGYDKLYENYFENVGNTLEYTKADIIGHFDLITKYNEGDRYFDTNDAHYLKCAEKALEKLSHIPFEVNVGAIARGWRTSPYPSLPILKKLCDMGGKVVYSSDCHDKKMLDFLYDDMLEYVKEAGFKGFALPEEIIRR